MVRRVVLGDSARDDALVTDQLQRLRRRANLSCRANLSYLGWRRPALRAELLARLSGYVERAEPGSLASLVASTPAPPGTAPVQQVPQWLFAFDAAAWAGFRALALLSEHPAAVTSARAESHQAPVLTTSTILSTLLEQHDPHLVGGAELRSTDPLPGTLSPFALRFQLVRRLEAVRRSPGGSVRVPRSHAPA